MGWIEFIAFGIIVYLIYTGVKTFKQSSQSGVLAKTQDGASEVVSEITKGADVIVDQIGSYKWKLKASAINSSVKKILKQNIKMDFEVSSRHIATYWGTRKGEQVLMGPFGKDRDLESWNLRFYDIKNIGQSAYTKGRLDGFLQEVSNDKILIEYCKRNNIQFLTITPYHNKESFTDRYRRPSEEFFRVYKLKKEEWGLIHNHETKEVESFNTDSRRY